MRTSFKNKLVVLLLGAITLPIIGIAVIMPRVNVINALTGSEDVKTEIYDVFFVNYGKDPKLEDTNNLTIKILLEMNNGDKTQKLIIPRLMLDLVYLDKPVGKVWSTEELILEPFVNKDSQSAGILTLYVSLYIGGESGVPEFINGLFLGEVGAIQVDLTLYLGDVPIVVNVKLGELLALLASGETSATGGFDAAGIFGMLGLGTDDEDFLIPEDYIFLKNNSFIRDIRALFNTPNQTIFRDKYEILLFGAKDSFDKIEWKNATNGNHAVGNGNYTWEYWNGNSWKPLSISDGTNNFTKSGTISFSKPGDWKSKQILDNFFTMDYFYVQCKVVDLDTGINTTVEENATLIRMNVKESYINDYEPPSSSSAANFACQVHSSNEKSSREPQILAKYPKLKDKDIPLDKGLLQTDMELEDYFLANGLDFNSLINDYVLPPFVLGLNKAYKTSWVNATSEDIKLTGDLDVEVILKQVLGFLACHEMGLTDFLLSCEFKWENVLTFIGENFEGWSAPDGIDAITGENIFAPISETSRYSNAILFSYVIMIVLLLILALIMPYYAQKKVDQGFVFKDIKNLDKYIEKVRKEMEKGITTEEISLLKEAAFKKKTVIEKQKIDEKGDKK